MAYITTADLAARLGPDLYARLTDRAGGITADSNVAQALVDEAEGLLNGYLARRYATPVSTTGEPGLADALRSGALDFAEYLAWRSSPFTSDLPERVRAGYDATRRWLLDVAEGRSDLPAAAAPPGGVGRPPAAELSGPARRFTRREFGDE